MNFNNYCLVALLLAFSCEITSAAERITIETKSSDFFENLVSDTLLLLDSDLKKAIDDDFVHVLTNSRFTLQVNSWKPRPNPKTKLANIYKNINSNNIKENFASLVQPVVEIACSPQQYDPMNEYQLRCIKELFTYPINQPIEFKYTYKPNKTIDQFIADLTGLNISNRYQQIVNTTADILNSAFENVRKKDVVRSVNVFKYPLKLVSTGVATGSTTTISSVNSKSETWKEKELREAKELKQSSQKSNPLPPGTNTSKECWDYCNTELSMCGGGSECQFSYMRCYTRCE